MGCVRDARTRTCAHAHARTPTSSPRGDPRFYADPDFNPNEGEIVQWLISKEYGATIWGAPERP